MTIECCATSIYSQFTAVAYLGSLHLLNWTIMLYVQFCLLRMYVGERVTLGKHFGWYCGELTALEEISLLSVQAKMVCSYHPLLLQSLLPLYVSFSPLSRKLCYGSVIM